MSNDSIKRITEFLIDSNLYEDVCDCIGNYFPFEEMKSVDNDNTYILEHSGWKIMLSKHKPKNLIISTKSEYNNWKINIFLNKFNVYNHIDINLYEEYKDKDIEDICSIVKRFDHVLHGQAHLNFYNGAFSKTLLCNNYNVKNRLKFGKVGL